MMICWVLPPWYLASLYSRALSFRIKYVSITPYFGDSKLAFLCQTWSFALCYEDQLQTGYISSLQLFCLGTCPLAPVTPGSHHLY